MSNENIVLARNTERAPKHPLAAQTVAFSHYNHLSAQLPIEPTSGQLVERWHSGPSDTMFEKYPSGC